MENRAESQNETVKNESGAENTVANEKRKVPAESAPLPEHPPWLVRRKVPEDDPIFPQHPPVRYFEYRNSYDEDGSVRISKYTGQLAEVRIPKEINGKLVTGIVYDSFEGCKGLTSVTIPSGVREEYDDWFLHCDNLTCINVDQDSAHFVSLGGILYSKDMSELVRYPAGKTDSTFKIPSRVTKIGANAFAFCKYLRNVEIPKSVTDIDYGAFQGCTSLKSVSIPDNVTGGLIEAFSGCKSLETVKLSSYMEYIAVNAFYGCESLKSISIPSSVERIYNAFDNCMNLENVWIPSGVIHVEEEVFAGCYNLKHIYYGGSRWQWRSVFEGVGIPGTTKIHYNCQV